IVHDSYFGLGNRRALRIRNAAADAAINGLRLSQSRHRGHTGAKKQHSEILENTASCQHHTPYTVSASSLRVSMALLARRVKRALVCRKRCRRSVRLCQYKIM